MRRYAGVVAAVGIVLAVGLLIRFIPALGGVDQLRVKLLSYGPWAVVISAALMIAQAVVAPIPGNIVSITNGLVFGPLWGALLSWVTMTAGASISFVLSRSFGKPLALRFAGESMGKADRFFKKYGKQAMFLSRIIPFVPFDAVSYAAGLIGVPYSTFLLATAIGTIPSILIYSYLGSVVGDGYWWILFGVLAVTMIGLVGALLASRKPRTSAFPQTRTNVA
jgi:uncharacterized membrane protein YdjX (TVP38/TMEM64 family)